MIRSRPPVDRLDHQGRTLLLFERQVVELSELAQFVHDAALDGIEPEALTDLLVATFGEPPTETPAEAVARIVEELRALGAVEPAPVADPIP